MSEQNVAIFLSIFDSRTIYSSLPTISVHAYHLPSPSPSPVASRVRTTTRNEIIATRTRVRNNTGILPLLIKNNAIRPWTATAIHVKRRQDGEFLPGARDREVEALVVVVLVRVGVGPQRLARLVQAIALVQRRVDVRLPVACRGAGLDAGLSGGEGGEWRSGGG